MGELAEVYSDLDKSRKAIKRKKNMVVLQDWLKRNKDRQCSVEMREHSVLFRLPDKPKADFYPTTNKWRSLNRTFHGDASMFLRWYGSR